MTPPGFVISGRPQAQARAGGRFDRSGGVDHRPIADAGGDDAGDFDRTIEATEAAEPEAEPEATVDAEDTGGD